jgi:alpha-L-fucosidase
MVGVGPSSNGQFHPEAARQMRAAGVWLKVNGEAIYATRPRDEFWSEGESIRYTRSNRQDVCLCDRVAMVRTGAPAYESTTAHSFTDLFARVPKALAMEF